LSSGPLSALCPILEDEEETSYRWLTVTARRGTPASCSPSIRPLSRLRSG
jgi:hypothetical protein